MEVKDMGRTFVVCMFVAVCCVVCTSPFVHAAWTPGGFCISGGNLDSALPDMIPDGSGGMIVVWMEARDTQQFDIYAQRIDAQGNIMWQEGGAPVCLVSVCYQWYPELVSDGEGGALVVWHEWRPELDYAKVYAQRIAADGSLPWETGPWSEGYLYPGIEVCNSTGSQLFPQITSDGEGGAIIVWADYRDDPFNKIGDIYAQRIDGDGELLWQESGVSVCDHNDISDAPCIVSDTSGGAIIVWADMRRHTNCLFGECWDLYAQRINASGTSLWQNNGLIVDISISSKFEFHMAPDGLGGVCIAWSDDRNLVGWDFDIYAQRLDGNGNRKWGSIVLPVTFRCDGPQEYPFVYPDGSGGAVIAWMDRRDWGNGSDIYAQKIGSSGETLWDDMYHGRAICTAGYTQGWPRIESDGSGGRFFVWMDYRNNNDYDLYAQRLDYVDDCVWVSNGIPIIEEDEEQELLIHLLNLDPGIFALVWEDSRGPGTGVNVDIYVHRIFGTADELEIPAIDDITATYYSSVKDSCFPVDGDHFVFGCPAGDVDTLFVDISLTDVDRDIAASRLTIDTTGTLDLCRLWRQPICAERDATSGNDYTTEFNVQYMSVNTPCVAESCACVLDSIPVRIDGIIMDHVNDIVVKSPDYNGDEVVDISDVGFFGPYYNTDDNCWFDFDGDGCVNLVEFAFYGEHYQHQVPPAAFQGYLAERELQSQMGVKVSTQLANTKDRHKRVAATIFLQNAKDISTVCIGIEYDAGELAFCDFKSTESLRDKIAITSMKKPEIDGLLLAGFELDELCGTEIEICTLEFVINEESGITDNQRSGLVVAFGDVLDVRGNRKRIVKITSEEEAIPIFNNYLADNYPNPFNPSTVIEYSLAMDSHVNLSIYDVEGRLVRTLVDEFQVKNNYTTNWEGEDNGGKPVASGVYFYRLKTNSYACSKKMILLR
jgi:hypothetical protein